MSLLVLSVSEAARRLGIPETELRKRVEDGQVRSVPFGDYGLRYIWESEVRRLKRLLDEQRSAS